MNDGFQVIATVNTHLLTREVPGKHGCLSGCSG